MARLHQIEAIFGAESVARADARHHALAAEQASRVWGKLKYLYHFDVEPPELVSVRSHVARPMLLTSPGHPPALVYDHHLVDHIQLESCIRTLDFTQQGRRRSLMRLYAERLYCAGRLVDSCATRASAEHIDEALDFASPVTEDQLKAVATNAAGQQNAVIAHEIAHAVLLLGDDDLRLRLARGVVNTAGGVFVGNDDFGAGDEVRVLGFESPTDMFNQVIANPDLLEESVCDALALMGTLPSTINSGADVVEAARSVVHSLHTMQLTSLIDLAARASGEISQLTMIDKSVQALARLFVFRAFAVAMTFQSLDFDPDEAEVVNSALADLGSPALATLINEFGINTLEHNLVAMQWTEQMFGELPLPAIRTLLHLDDERISYFGPGVPILR